MAATCAQPEVVRNCWQPFDGDAPRRYVEYGMPMLSRPSVPHASEPVLSQPGVRSRVVRATVLFDHDELELCEQAWCERVGLNMRIGVFEGRGGRGDYVPSQDLTVRPILRLF